MWQIFCMTFWIRRLAPSSFLQTQTVQSTKKPKILWVLMSFMISSCITYSATAQARTKYSVLPVMRLEQALPARSTPGKPFLPGSRCFIVGSLHSSSSVAPCRTDQKWAPWRFHRAVIFGCRRMPPARFGFPIWKRLRTMSIVKNI